MSLRHNLMALTFSLTLASLAAHADRNADINRSLQEFSENPKAFYEKLPPKVHSSGNAAVRRSRISDDDLFQEKMEFRDKIRASSAHARASSLSLHPNARGLDLDDTGIVDLDANQEVRTPTEMAAQNLEEATVPELPWSDGYWPMYQGMIAARYADPSFAQLKPDEFPSYYNYIQQPGKIFPDILKNVTDNNAPELMNLAPSEKYDLLVGDNDATLTNDMWSESQDMVSGRKGNVEHWMGLCDGWAQAAFMSARPHNTVKVTAPDGQTEISFFPSDVKALIALLWSRADVDSRFVGTRCYKKKPATDENGRITDEECYGTNPGDWHINVVNQIGLAKRSFVIDAARDYEVWNQPMVGYKYSYFNPVSRRAVKSLESATASLADFKDDIFKKYRSRKAVSIVGIAMDVTYVDETDPSHKNTDGAKDDAHTTVRYMYDLELNAKGQIIGGEWYHRARPDFIWNPTPGSTPASPGDENLNASWDGVSALPKSWRRAAISKSSPAGQPLAGIVQALLSRAQ